MLRNTLICVCCFLLLLVPSCEAATIEFSLEDLTTSRDLEELLKPATAYQPLDQEKYQAVGKGYLVSSAPIYLSDGMVRHLLLTCSEIRESGNLRNIQLVLVDGSGSSVSVVQRIKMGDGELPEFLFPAALRAGSTPEDLMVRILRRENNTEAYVYAINPSTGKLVENLRIGRSFPKRMNLDLRGTMHLSGRIEVESGKPPLKENVDLSGALDALVEDEIYQENGRPVPALANLSCVRNGWEDEGIYMGRKDEADESGDGVRVEVGLSLATLSKKQVVHVTAILRKEQPGEKTPWRVVAFRLEPFLPYQI